MPMTRFFQSALWNDGLAEVSLYDATRTQYGVERSFAMTLITVKEDFDPDQMVKSDSPREGRTLGVIKNHLFFTMPTENYPYNFAASSFISRSSPLHLWKMSVTASEWCGITTRLLRGWKVPAELEYRSYFDGESEGLEPLDWPANGVTEEQLLVSLRALDFSEGLRRSIHVLERQIDSHAGPPTWRRGELHVTGRESLQLHGGSEVEAWRVRIELRDGSRLSYAFGVDSPHLLLEHEGPGGVRLALRESRRWAYWDR